jgi:hypothetical protein
MSLEKDEHHGEHVQHLGNIGKVATANIAVNVVQQVFWSEPYIECVCFSCETRMACLMLLTSLVSRADPAPALQTTAS